MVDYIGIEDIRRLVDALGTGEFIAAAGREIEDDYRRWDEFEKCPRLANHSPVGVIELMPITDGRRYTFKYVNGHPQNTARGLLTVTAFGVLADVETGYPLLLSELTVTTALRTAAMSALAARWMARDDSRVMALIGNGSQGEFQAIGFRRLLGIEELRLFDVDPLATAKLVRNLASMPEMSGVKVMRASSASDACRGADIVTTVTADKRNAIILTPPMVRPGMHLNAVGGDCPGKTELHPDILRRPGRAWSSSTSRSRASRERSSSSRATFRSSNSPTSSGAARAGRSERDEVTIFDSVGFALEDYSALRFLHSLLREERSGRRQIDLVPDLDGPQGPVRRHAGAGPHAAAACGGRLTESLMHAKVSLVGAPTDIGASTRGASMGPEALRVAGLQQTLEAQGVEVVDRGNLCGPGNPCLPPVDGYRHLAEVAAWNRLVHDAVHGELAAGAAADPARRRPQPRDRLDQRRSPPLPRDRQATARALARCARRLQHQRADAERQPARHAGRMPLRPWPA